MNSDEDEEQRGLRWPLEAQVRGALREASNTSISRHQ